MLNCPNASDQNVYKTRNILSDICNPMNDVCPKNFGETFTFVAFDRIILDERNFVKIYFWTMISDEHFFGRPHLPQFFHIKTEINLFFP